MSVLGVDGAPRRAKRAVALCAIVSRASSSSSSSSSAATLRCDDSAKADKSRVALERRCRRATEYRRVPPRARVRSSARSFGGVQTGRDADARRWDRWRRWPREQSVAQRKGEMKTFVGFDVDQSAIEIAKPRIEKCLGMNERGDANGVKVHFVQNNFDQMRAALEDIGVRGADSILLDLGVSSMHLDRAERGFSFQNDGPLDMRMSCVSNGTSSSSSSSSSSSLPSLTAFDVVNGWSEEDLGRIFRDYGGERHWKLLAKRVCERRIEKPIETTLELVKALGNPPGKREKIHRRRAFQAVRIATNDELGVIERVIPQAIEILNPGGRLAIITFHSLEDAIVKKQFRKFASVPESREPTVGGSAMMSVSPDDINQSNPPKIVKMINRKPISATDEEIKVNARSRSAKLRVVEKL